MTKQKVQLRFLRIAPRKVRSVAYLMKGLSVNDAEAQLLHEHRRPAKPLLKLLRSAVAAAKATKKLDPAKLFVARCTVDQGPMLKRSLPRARGMATPIQKKMSHVELVLAEREVGAPRFTIVVEKKVKLPQEERARSARKKAAEEKTSPRAESKPGFFKRFFRRKSV